MKSNLLCTLFDAFKNVAMIQLSRKYFRQTQMKWNEMKFGKLFGIIIMFAIC